MLDFDSKCVGQGAKSEKTQETYIMKLIFLWKHKQALWGRKKMVHDNRLSSFCSSYVVLNIEEISIYCLLLSWWCTLSSPLLPPPPSLLWEEKYQKIAWLGMGRWNLPSWWGMFWLGYISLDERGDMKVFVAQMIFCWGLVGLSLLPNF